MARRSTANSLLFAISIYEANLAVQKWRWEFFNELRCEYRRPDNLERVRFVPDSANGDVLKNLRWGTRVYLVDGWDGRHDHCLVTGLIDLGFFQVIDPVLEPSTRTTSTEARLRRLVNELKDLKI